MLILGINFGSEQIRSIGEKLLYIPHSTNVSRSVFNRQLKYVCTKGQELEARK